MSVHIKRIYDPASDGDGFRILVDRLWPRGIRKEEAHIHVWLKEIAPSTELRKWYHAHLSDREEFGKKYEEELRDSPAVEELAGYVRSHRTVTLLFASKDVEHNHASVLRSFLEKHRKQK